MSAINLSFKLLPRARADYPFVFLMFYISEAHLVPLVSVMTLMNVLLQMFCNWKRSSPKALPWLGRPAS